MQRQSQSTNALHSVTSIGVMVMPANEQPTNRDVDPAKFTLMNNNFVGGGGNAGSPSKPSLNTTSLGSSNTGGGGG
jgi:hypothetical protein